MDWLLSVPSNQVVDDQRLDAVQLAHRLVVAVIQPRGAQPFEQPIGPVDPAAWQRRAATAAARRQPARASGRARGP
jgi:hypothetical protein